MEKKLLVTERQLQQNTDNVKIILTKKRIRNKEKKSFKNYRNSRQFNLQVMETIKPWIAMNYKITFEKFLERLNNKVLCTRQGNIGMLLLLECS
jgi:hypothetical protein